MSLNKRESSKFISVAQGEQLEIRDEIVGSHARSCPMFIKLVKQSSSTRF